MFYIEHIPSILIRTDRISPKKSRNITVQTHYEVMNVVVLYKTYNCSEAISSNREYYFVLLLLPPF